MRVRGGWWPGLGVVGWGQLAKGRGEPDGVVLDPPVLHQYPGLPTGWSSLHDQQPEGQGKEGPDDRVDRRRPDRARPDRHDPRRLRHRRFPDVFTQLHASSKAAFGSILLVTTALGGGPSILARVVLIVALLAITTPLPPMPAPRRPTTSASRCAPAAIDAPHARRWGCAGSEAQGVRSVTPSPEAS